MGARRSGARAEVLKWESSGIDGPRTERFKAAREGGEGGSKGDSERCMVESLCSVDFRGGGEDVTRERTPARWRAASRMRRRSLV